MDIFKWFRRKPEPVELEAVPVPRLAKAKSCSCCGEASVAYNTYSSGDVICLACVRKGHRHAAR